METMSIDEQVYLNELYAERDDLFQELCEFLSRIRLFDLTHREGGTG